MILSLIRKPVSVNVTALELVRGLKYGLMIVAAVLVPIGPTAKAMLGSITQLARVPAILMINIATSPTPSIKRTTTAHVSAELLKPHAKVLRFSIKTTVDVTALTGRVAMDI